MVSASNLLGNDRWIFESSRPGPFERWQRWKTNSTFFFFFLSWNLQESLPLDTRNHNETADGWCSYHFLFIFGSNVSGEFPDVYLPYAISPWLCLKKIRATLESKNKNWWLSKSCPQMHSCWGSAKWGQWLLQWVGMKCGVMDGRCMDGFIHSFVRSFLPSFLPSFLHPFIHSFMDRLNGWMNGIGRSSWVAELVISSLCTFAGDQSSNSDRNCPAETGSWGGRACDTCVCNSLNWIVTCSGNNG